MEIVCKGFIYVIHELTTTILCVWQDLANAPAGLKCWELDETLNIVAAALDPVGHVHPTPVARLHMTIRCVR